MVFHEPLVVRSDVRHSRGEKRYYALGQTSAEQRLFIAGNGQAGMPVLLRRSRFGGAGFG